MDLKRHPGITMHKLSIGDGFAGLVFTIGSALIFVLGLPALWYFVAFAFGLGLAVAVFLKLVHRSRSDRNRPLSIIAGPENVQSAEAKNLRGRSSSSRPSRTFSAIFAVKA